MNESVARTGRAPSNFTCSLPARNSSASELLGISGEAGERDLEQALMDRTVRALRELGRDLAVVADRCTSTSAAMTSTLTGSTTTVP